MQTKSGRMLSLSLGMEPLLHMDCDAPNYAFNPCGHMGSHATVLFAAPPTHSIPSDSMI